MGKVTYVAADGAAKSYDIADGKSVMQGAMDNGLDGIVAECGGSMMCATCHVYVREPWLSKLPAPDETEDAMLTMTASARKANSRLSCQIKMSTEFDGIIVDLPETQL